MYHHLQLKCTFGDSSADTDISPESVSDSDSKLGQKYPVSFERVVLLIKALSSEFVRVTLLMFPIRTFIPIGTFLKSF